jgi:endonuclease YncB( thermonuclease family)
MGRALCLVIALILGPAGVRAAEIVARVASVVDGDTVVLDGGGEQVRLVGIQAPKLPLGRAGFRAWPLAEESKKALQDLVLGKRVTLTFGGRRRDRHGRLLAHLRGEDGTWIQGAMLARGMARVYSFPDNRSRVADMLKMETRARTQGRGIWGLDYYAVIGPENAARAIGTFQVVEGRVVDAAKVKGRTYLNFGPDWRTDFTVTIPPGTAKIFRDLAPLTLKGRRIRVRGWLKSYNGPSIEATHPEQIEVLAD